MSSRFRPKILLYATMNWFSSARLGLALAGNGIDVATVTPLGHSVRKLPSIEKNFTSVSPVASASFVARTIATWSPDLIVPCDDFAVRMLHEMHARAARGAGRAPHAIRTLIERSIGHPTGFEIARKKSELVRMAASLGIAVPETTVVRTPDEFEAALATMPFPLVLKVDGASSWAGTGVRVVANVAAARRAYRELRAIGGWWWAAKPALRTLSWRPFAQRRNDGAPTVSVQRFVGGVPANRAVVCWQGQVLAGLSVEALQTSGATGFATVVRVVDDDDMTRAAHVLARRLRLSGFAGFDFIIEAGTGKPFLLEMNPRPTQICHLSLDAASDMAGELYEQLSGSVRAKSSVGTSPRIIALFPGEAQRDPQSEYLRSSFHDVPWDSPELVRGYAGSAPALLGSA
jgi:glutathione synthase/RimK-type ligase-like ATP-grasp enzyme